MICIVQPPLEESDNDTYKYSGNEDSDEEVKRVETLEVNRIGAQEEANRAQVEGAS